MPVIYGHSLPKSPVTISISGSLPRNHSFQDLNSLKQSFEDSNLNSSSPTSRYEQDFLQFEEVGCGGFGKVFKVKNKLDREIYAMKKIVFKKKISHSQMKRVLREVKALARLDHPNVVRYYQAWIEEKSGDIFSKRYSSLSSSSDENECGFEENDEESRSEDALEEDDFLFNRQDDSLFNPQDDFLFDIQEDFGPPTLTQDDLGPPTLTQSQLIKNPSKSWRARIHQSLQPVSTTTIYIQMQLYEDTLQNWFDVRSTLDPLQNLAIFKQICKGLKYIHSQNIIHRVIIN